MRLVTIATLLVALLTTACDQAAAPTPAPSVATSADAPGPTAPATAAAATAATAAAGPGATAGATSSRTSPMAIFRRNTAADLVAVDAATGRVAAALPLGVPDRSWSTLYTTVPK